MNLTKMIEELPKQSWINVYRRNILQDAKTKSAIHFKHVENDTPLSSVFSIDGAFIRIEVTDNRKTVVSVDIVEYTPCTSMHWVPTNEMKHWSAIPRMYQNVATRETFKVICESQSLDGKQLVTYTRADVDCAKVFTVAKEVFFGKNESGDDLIRLVREARV